MQKPVCLRPYKKIMCKCFHPQASLACSIYLEKKRCMSAVKATLYGYFGFSLFLGTGRGGGGGVLGKGGGGA